jgi:hypothetical protein
MKAEGLTEQVQSVGLLLFLLALSSGTAALARTYTTSFALTEDPISEGGNWINGKTTGIDWANLATTNGMAIGLESGFTNTSLPGGSQRFYRSVWP